MLFKLDKRDSIYALLLFAVVTVCVGRFYQCVFWDIPIRSLLWNEDLMTPIIQLGLNLNWDEYIVHPNSDSTIQSIVTACGWALLILLGFTLSNLSTKLSRFSLYAISGILVGIALLYHLEKFRTAGQFFEYSLQFLSPLFLLSYLKYGLQKSWLLFLKIGIALTFISHGLYALGFYPVPGNFVTMTIKIFHCSDAMAKVFLQVVGILDIIFSLGLFFNKSIYRLSIWYCIIWGFLTALARIVANVEIAAFGSTMHQWAYETVYRIPHFVIPLILKIAMDKTAPSATEIK